MPPPSGGSDGSARLNAVLRALGLIVGFGLATAGVWLIVTTDTVRNQRLGALLGIWGVVLGAWALYGTRRHDTIAVSESGRELMVRAAGGLETLVDAAAAREYEARLQAMLRREIQQTLGAELASLRSEVAALRSELVEKVGGELRLERIETTRLIGSDIEALQREVRQLKTGGRADDDLVALGRAAVADADAAAGVHTVDAEVVDERPRPAPQPLAPTFETAPMPAVPRIASAADSAPATSPQPSPRPDPVAEPAPPHPQPAYVDDEPTPAPRPQPAYVDEPVPTVAAESGDEHAPAPTAWPDAEPNTHVNWPPPVPEPAASAPAADISTPSSDQPAPAYSPQADFAPAPASPAPYEPAAPEPEPSTAGFDPFASLPRIRPFTEFDLDPVEQPVVPPVPAAPSVAADAGPHEGGRRRREDHDGDDVLGRILERERQHG